MLDSLGLLPALHRQFERYTKQTGVQVNFQQSGLEQRLPGEIETGAYRLIQEALTNVARYADIAAVTVQVLATAETLTLFVVDDGLGFDVEAALEGGRSTGLASMRERADLLGGRSSLPLLRGMEPPSRRSCHFSPLFTPWKRFPHNRKREVSGIMTTIRRATSLEMCPEMRSATWRAIAHETHNAIKPVTVSAIAPGISGATSCAMWRETWRETQPTSRTIPNDLIQLIQGSVTRDDRRPG